MRKVSVVAILIPIYVFLTLSPGRIMAQEQRGAPAVDPVQHAISNLRAKDVNLRRQAAEELSRLRDQRAATALIVGLNDDDPSVRAGVARALGLMRSRDAAKDLSRVATSDPVASVRQSAIVALGFISDPGTVPQLVKALKDNSDEVRLAAAQTLGTLRSKEAIAPLEELLKDSNASLRRVAVSSLGQIGDVATTKSLAALLNDSDPSTRALTCRALGQLGGADFGPAIKELLKDKELNVQVAASYGLGKLGDNSGLATARKMLKEGKDSSLRAQAAEALGEIGDKSALPDLQIAAKDKDVFIAQASQLAIEKIKAKTGIKN